MRKNAKCVLVALLSFCFVVNVNAAECSYEKQVELNNIASTVKATYEEVEIDTGETTIVTENTEEHKMGDVIKITKPGFAVKILNISNDIGVTIEDSYSNSKTYYYSDTDNGSLTLEAVPADDVITYTISVFGFTNDCAGTELRTITVVTPVYNSYSEYLACDNYPEYEYCQKYLTTNTDISFDKFTEGLNQYANQIENNQKVEEENTNKNSIMDFIKKNKQVIILIISVLAVISLIIIIIFMIRKKKRII